MINSGDNTISADHTSGERRARQMTSLESMFQQLLTMQVQPVHKGHNWEKNLTL